MIIKVCGMREDQNIRETEQLGIDLIGLIFYPPSPRFVASKPGYLPQRAKKAGVFVNESPETIGRYIETYQLDFIQLHGHESPGVCRQWQQRGVKVIKSIPVSEQGDLRHTDLYEGCCDLLLFDTRTPSHGGSGVAFDWNILSDYQGDTPFLLSGGICDIDARRIRLISHPRLAGVDLNSRFELSPGLKDIERLAHFISEIKSKNNTCDE